MSDADLLAELLAKPIGPTRASTPPSGDLTRELEVSPNQVVATITDEPGKTTTDTARTFLEDEGLDPDEWEATGFTKSQWGEGKESVRFTFKKRAERVEVPRWDVAEVEALVGSIEPLPVRPWGDYGALVLVGDMQFGKIDGDGPAGTVARTIRCIDEAVEQIEQYRHMLGIGHVHVAWLGDHVEGFVSQGGANAWRTQLTLSEQIRLTRRVMLHALVRMAPLADKVSMAALPGNHGETIRFAGAGITRYDDSHDTESLIAVKDAADFLPERFGHVKFYVPDTDELTVVVEVAGTRVAHHHGHKWRPGKHFEWWRGQSFDRDSSLRDCDLLVAGHLHHEHIDTDGTRTFIGVPAMESESTWFKHHTGTGGAPGLILALTRDGETPIKHTITARSAA